MGAYATKDDLDAYLEDGIPEGYDDAYIERVLELASDDIDRYATGFVRIGVNERKFYVTDAPRVWAEGLDAWQQAVLTEATCAQAEYRLAKGDQFFVEAQVGGTRRSAEGLRINVESEPRLGPKVVEVFRTSGWRVRTVWATAR